MHICILYFSSQSSLRTQPNSTTEDAVLLLQLCIHWKGNAPGLELTMEALTNSLHWGLLHRSHDKQFVSVRIAVLSEICHEKVTERNQYGRGAMLTDFSYHLKKRRKKYYHMLYGSWISADGTFCCTVERKMDFTQFLHRSYKICTHPLYTKQVCLLLFLIYHTFSAYLPAPHCVLYSTTVIQHNAVGQRLDICTALQSFYASSFQYSCFGRLFCAGWKSLSTFPSPHGSEFANDHI